jgi:hypothetical protein
MTRNFRKPDFSMQEWVIHLVLPTLSGTSRQDICYNLDLECPPKVHVLRLGARVDYWEVLELLRDKA